VTEQAEVSMRVAAAADHLWALVADLPSMGRWSPECFRVSWLRGARAATPGARFRGYNRNGWRLWWTTGTVVAAEPGRTLSFDVASLGMPASRWTYEFAPDGNGCVVTERWQDRRGRLLRSLGGLATGVADRASHNAEGMRATLDRLRTVVETG
jgi:hypothetical protein